MNNDNADFGVLNNNNNFDDQIPDEYKNDPELYRAIQESLRELNAPAASFPDDLEPNPTTPPAKKNDRSNIGPIHGFSINPNMGQDPLTNQI